MWKRLEEVVPEVVPEDKKISNPIRQLRSGLRRRKSINDFVMANKKRINESLLLHAFSVIEDRPIIVPSEFLCSNPEYKERSSLYSGGVLSSDGKIYFIPSGAFYHAAEEYMFACLCLFCGRKCFLFLLVDL